MLAPHMQPLLNAAFGLAPWPKAVAEHPEAEPLLGEAQAAARGFDWMALARILDTILQLVLNNPPKA